jgi:spermidine synthase
MRSPRDPRSAVAAAVVVAFFLSGASALVYEVVWMRKLSLIFGNTTYAAATTMSAFMAGLAVGSYVLGRTADRGRNPLVLYALLELGIAAYALAAPVFFDLLAEPYVALRRLDLSAGLLTAGRSVLAAAVLLVPTFLMGGTFPVLARLFVHLHGDVGRATSLLYFVNTAGAVAGCLMAGFALIEKLGLVGATWVAAAVNVALASGVLLLARAAGAPLPGARAEAAPARPMSAPEARTLLVLSCIGVAGFVSLGHEVFWTRVLVRYLHNSTYAFSTMLATFLAGIAIGSWLYSVLPGRRSRPVLLFAGLQAGAAAGFLLSSLLFADLKAVSEVLAGSEIAGFGDSVLAWFTRAGLVLFLPALMAGACVPLATDVCTRELEKAGHGIGRVYAVNTIGAVLGSLSVAFVAIPTLGLLGSLRLLIGINLALAAVLAFASLPSLRGRAIAAAGVVALALATSLVPGDLFRRIFESRADVVRFYREGVTDTVAVLETNGQRAIVLEDQRGTAATFTHRLNFFFGHLPVLLHPGEPRTALHICFGVGNSLSAIAAHDSFERIDSVELSRGVIEAADWFWTNGGVIHDERVRTIVDDGRNFVLAASDQYDVIGLEPPEVFTAGVINLYTREFYEDARERLTADGVMIQWIPIGEAPVDEERMLFRAFFEVFPHATAWTQNSVGGAILLVASKQPLRIDYQRLRTRMRDPRVRADMELMDVRDADHLLSMFVFDSREFERFVRDVDPVTDDKTVLDFTMPRYVGSGFGFGSFNQALSEGAQSPLAVLYKRGVYYYEQRVSVVPYLTNLGATPPAAIEARLRAMQPPSIFERMTPVPQEEWARPGRAPASWAMPAATGS